MSERALAAIELARAQQQLQQDAATFDQWMKHNNRWFRARIVMVWIAVVFIPALAIFCTSVIVNYRSFPAVTVGSASIALLVDVLALIGGVWKFVLTGDPSASFTQPPKVQGASSGEMNSTDLLPSTSD